MWLEVICNTLVLVSTQSLLKGCMLAGFGMEHLDCMWLWHLFNYFVMLYLMLKLHSFSNIYVHTHIHIYIHTHTL